MTDIVGPSSSVGSTTTRPSDGRQWGPQDTWFVDCSTPLSDDGTDIPAAWLNQVTGFFRNIIRANGLKRDGVNPVVPLDQSDNMVLNALQQMAQRGQGNYGQDTGGADALLVAPAVAPAEYKPGMRFYVLKNPSVGANATATPTVDFGLGAITIVKNDASALGVGDLKKGVLFEVELDGTYARLVGLTTISDVLALIASKAPAGSIVGNGWWRDPTTGYTKVWGTGQTTNGAATVTLARSLTTVFGALAVDNGASTWNTSNASFCGVSATSTTSISIQSVTWRGSSNGFVQTTTLFYYEVTGLS